MNPRPSLKTQELGLRIADKVICDRLDLELNPGTIWGILGQNGSGKTTLLHTLAGLNTSFQGEIYLAEKKLASYSAKKRAQLIGLMFQESQPLFPQTVWDYCLAGRYPHLVSFIESAQDKAKAKAALELMHLDQLHSRNICTLSGGEWRRLAFAVLLAQNPSIYLLDEPLNHLDLAHQKLLLDYLRSEAEHNKITVLMTLHDLNLAERYCDQILILSGKGKTVAGEKRELLKEDRLSELYGQPLRLYELGSKKWWIAE